MRTLWFSAPSDDSDKKQSLEKEYFRVASQFGTEAENNIIFNMLNHPDYTKQHSDRAIDKGVDFTSKFDGGDLTTNQFENALVSHLKNKHIPQLFEKESASSSSQNKRTVSFKSFYTKKTKEVERDNIQRMNYFHRLAASVIYSKKPMKGFSLSIGLVSLLLAIVFLQLTADLYRFYFEFLNMQKINMSLIGPSLCCSVFRGEVGVVDAIDLVLLDRKGLVQPSRAIYSTNKTLSQMAEVARKYYKTKNFRYYNLRVNSILSLGQPSYAIQRKKLDVILFDSLSSESGEFTASKVGIQEALVNLEGRFRAQQDLSLNVSAWVEGKLGYFDQLQAKMRKNMYGEIGWDGLLLLENSISYLNEIARSNQRGVFEIEIASICLNLIIAGTSALVFIYWKFQMDKINFLLFSLKVVSVDRSKPAR